MADVMTSAKNKAQEMANTYGQAATSAADTLKNAASNAADQVKDMASNVSENVSKAGSYLDSRAEDATGAVGGGLKAAGEAIRQYAPQEGRFGQATSSVAQSLTDTGEYIEREGLSGICEDITSMIKNNPIPALFIGIGLGFLLSRATSSRS